MSDRPEVEDALKQLREVDAPEAVPDILTCLNHVNANVVRDACRTLAVLGDKDVIPSIEPLLNDPRSDVRKDAKDAIEKLQSKPAGEITEKALIFRGKLKQIDPGSMALRFWIGMGSGLPNVRITGEIIDAKSNETLIRFERNRVGALRKQGYDEALDHCLEVLADDVEYLLNVFKGSQ
jgi:HEAT repeat protein